VLGIAWSQCALEQEYAFLRVAKGSVVGVAQRGRRVVAGSRLAVESAECSSTGWCLVESPDDESPSGPRNEEGHGRCLACFCDGRWSVWGLRCAHLEEREPWLSWLLRLVKTGLRVRRTLHAET